MKYIIYIVNLFALLLLGAQSANAQANQASLDVEVESISFERPFWVALNLPVYEGQTIALDENLVSGMNWSLADGFILADVIYPTPQALNEAGAYYNKPLTILFEIIPPPLYEQNNIAPSLPYIFNLNANWRVCQSECNEQSRDFKFELLAGEGRLDNTVAQIFYNARNENPAPLSWPVSIYINSYDYKLSLLAVSGDISTNSLVFIPTEKGFNATPAHMVDQTGDSFNLLGGAMVGKPALDAPYKRTINGLLLSLDAGEIVGASRVFATNSKDEIIVWQTNESPSTPNISFITAITLAFIGGLILNLMPCVFPILAMKAFHLASMNNKSASQMRADGMAYSLGILTSFVIVASVLIVIRSLGIAAGWGFQLQSPIFILMLIWVMTAVVLNFLGVFEFKLGNLQNIGQGGALSRVFGGGEQAKAFSTGVLATVVATPCTAPFMAPAIGFALIQAPLNSLFIFLSLGAGLAFPYLLLSFIPAFANMLPKPGPWMVHFRRWLALPLALTVVWLLWVLAKQVSITGFMFALFAILSFAVSIILLQRKPLKKLGVVSILMAVAFLFIVVEQRPQKSEQITLPGIINGLETVEWSPQMVAGYRNEGRPIFLNVTAAWCITCLVHEKLVFENDSFQTYLKENNIVYMVADWTNPDSRIAALLAQYGRSGIPFYLYYPANADKAAVMLPEVLTPASTIRALENNR